MRRRFVTLILTGGLLAGCGSSPQPEVHYFQGEDVAIPPEAEAAYAETLLPALEMMLAVFNDQGIDVTLPDFPEQPTAFAVNVQHGVGAEGPPYATAEATMRAVYDLLVGADLDCAEFEARWISCDASGWNIHVIDIDGPIIGPAGSRITISVVPQSPDSS